MKTITIIKNNNGMYSLFEYEQELLRAIMLYIKKKNNSESNTVSANEMNSVAKVILTEKEIVVEAFGDIRVIKVEDSLEVEIYDEAFEYYLNNTIKKLSKRRLHFTKR